MDYRETHIIRGYNIKLKEFYVLLNKKQTEPFHTHRESSLILHKMRKLEKKVLFLCVISTKTEAYRQNGAFKVINLICQCP